MSKYNLGIVVPITGEDCKRQIELAYLKLLYNPEFNGYPSTIADIIGLELDTLNAQKVSQSITSKYAFKHENYNISDAEIKAIVNKAKSKAIVRNAKNDDEKQKMLKEAAKMVFNVISKQYINSYLESKTFDELIDEVIKSMQIDEKQNILIRFIVPYEFNNTALYEKLSEPFCNAVVEYKHDKNNHIVENTYGTQEDTHGEIAIEVSKYESETNPLFDELHELTKICEYISVYNESIGVHDMVSAINRSVKDIYCFTSLLDKCVLGQFVTRNDVLIDAIRDSCMYGSRLSDAIFCNMIIEQYNSDATIFKSSGINALETEEEDKAYLNKEYSNDKDGEYSNADEGYFNSDELYQKYKGGYTRNDIWFILCMFLIAAIVVYLIARICIVCMCRQSKHMQTM